MNKIIRICVLIFCTFIISVTATATTTITSERTDLRWGELIGEYIGWTIFLETLGQTDCKRFMPYQMLIPSSQRTVSQILDNVPEHLVDEIKGALNDEFIEDMQASALFSIAFIFDAFGFDYDDTDPETEAFLCGFTYANWQTSYEESRNRFYNE